MVAMLACAGGLETLDNFLFILTPLSHTAIMIKSQHFWKSQLLSTNPFFLVFSKDNLLHCLKMLNNVTLSRNNFEHFPTGPPKQFAAVQVGLSINTA